VKTDEETRRIDDIFWLIYFLFGLEVDQSLILTTSAGSVQQVTTFKLLVLHLDVNLSRTVHIGTIIAKGCER